ncbi:hypothetical protein Drose_01440 [Dactylosporangium roseum]|uniref:Uncharacterized protein n=1 Tax=Dactylosporangium roseum TaxID=47989 RepID=A0ABY5Z7K0_9ACTN|nr:hypothetical protein [Dactylosporangium roseum]UWZ37018.1 hypothetical protein Drose_01440 [Dactylosporangium roseum]
MDHSSHVTLGGFLAGGVVGFGIGVLYAIARRAWRDVAAAKETATGAGKAAWSQTGEFVILGFFLAVIAALALGGIGDR